MSEPYGYSRSCTACGSEINGCNMYGMGTCPKCGFKDNPVQDDNQQRAREWRLEHPYMHYHHRIEKEPVSIDIDILCGQIALGDLDSDLKKIREAIAQRISVRQEEVLALVQELHGPNATINITR